jgi:hypothetical protein
MMYIYVCVGVCVKFKPEKAIKDQRGYSNTSTLSLTSALDRDGLSTPRPGALTREGEMVPIIQEASLVASRYTD